MPNLVMKLYAELGITSTEMMLIQHVWLFWYEKQEDMFPALTTIAERMGLKRRQVQAYVSSLKEKRYHDSETGYESQPYLQIRERYATSGGQLSNQYDFSGLLAAVIFLAKKKGLIADSAQEAKPTTPQQKTTRGGMQKTARGGVQKTATEEDEVEEDEFQKDEDSSKNALKAEVVSAYSQREHMATGNGKDKPSNPNRKPQEKARTPVFVGKPITQDEIDEKRRQGKNTSGVTPLSGIIPPEHWQELERREGKAPLQNTTHYNNSTQNSPVFIDAIIEQFTDLLGDNPENAARNINRTAKLYRKVGLTSDDFRTMMYEAFNQSKRYSSGKIKKQRSDGRPNRMPVFFAILEERVGQKLPD
ncbi:MAG: helix-turn-helix domain-containing protein [Ktedonobacteraceae bacterium]